MLTSGGLLGLLLMGAAVGGLLTALHGDGDEAEDDMTHDDDGPVTPGEETHLAPADWLDAAENGAARSPDPTGAEGSSLSALLFGRQAQPDADEAAPFDTLPAEAAPASGADDDAVAHATALVPMETAPTDMSHAAPPDGLVDILRVIDVGPGPAIPFVTGFEASTDRLILDFPGAADEAPRIGVDLESSPGDALVLADGVPVTFVAGATDLTAAHIDTVMRDTGTAVEADTETAVAEHAASVPVSATGGYEALKVIRDFDPSTQQIEIDYDPAVFADPHLAIRTAEDGSGAQILLDGEVVVSVAGTTGLDPEVVVLRPV